MLLPRSRRADRVGAASLARSSELRRPHGSTRTRLSFTLRHVNRVAFGFLASALVASLGGCSTIRASAVPTGPIRLPPRSGPVAIYAAGYPVGGVDLGIVEARAAQSEANVETLLPVFVTKVAQLGGNAAVIEGVEARFDVTTHVHVESYSYPCGYYTCVGTRTYPVAGEVMTVIMRGRAVSVGAGKALPPESTIGGEGEGAGVPVGGGASDHSATVPPPPSSGPEKGAVGR